MVSLPIFEDQLKGRQNVQGFDLIYEKTCCILKKDASFYTFLANIESWGQARTFQQTFYWNLQNFNSPYLLFLPFLN